MKKYFLVLAILLSSFLHVSAQTFFSEAIDDKSICGPVDERISSDDPKVARVRQAVNRAGCTLTMIGRSCAVSAGHCENSFEQAEFHVPLSVAGRSAPPAQENIYLVDQSSIESDIRRPNRGAVEGTDWAVMRLLPNRLTGLYAGDVQGHYAVTFRHPRLGDELRITGHGNSPDPELTYTQQTHLGVITEMTRESVIYHNVDTTPGNSGSAIILEQTQEVIGIHTHGGCRVEGGANSGTLLATNRDFARAIEQCLALEAALP